VQIDHHQLDAPLGREPGAQPEGPIAHQLRWVVDPFDCQSFLPEMVYQAKNTYRYEEIVAQIFKASINVMFGRMDVQDIGHGGIASYSATKL
jgi:hypothetical protein